MNTVDVLSLTDNGAFMAVSILTIKLPDEDYLKTIS